MQLHLFGQPFGCMGIPNHTRDLFYHLARANASDTKIYLLYPEASRDRYDIDKIKGMINNWPTQKIDGVVFSFWGPDFNDKILSVCDRKNTIAIEYCVFEWTKLTDKYYEDAMKMDYLCVPSQWHLDVLVNNGIPSKKIYILKAGISDVFKNFDYKGNDLRPRDMIFVGKYEKRKCVDELLQAYYHYVDVNTSNKKSSLHLDVLISDPHNPKFDVKNLNINTPGLHILNNVARPEDMAALYSKYKYIIVPSRSGGIELPLIEAMAMGCIPIVTKTSGMKCYADEVFDFAQSIKPVWVNFNKMEPIYDNRWFPPSIDWGEWASVTTGNILESIMEAEKLNYGLSIHNATRESTLKKFDYTAIAKGFIDWVSIIQ